MKVKEESEKTGLKLNIQKTKIMASGPITSWQLDRKTMETVRWLDGITDLMDMNLSKLWEIVKDRGAWGVAAHGVLELHRT